MWAHLSCKSCTSGTWNTGGLGGRWGVGGSEGVKYTLGWGPTDWIFASSGLRSRWKNNFCVDVVTREDRCSFRGWDKRWHGWWRPGSSWVSYCRSLTSPCRGGVSPKSVLYGVPFLQFHTILYNFKRIHLLVYFEKDGVWKGVNVQRADGWNTLVSLTRRPLIYLPVLFYNASCRKGEFPLACILWRVSLSFDMSTGAVKNASSISLATVIPLHYTVTQKGF